MVVVTGESLQGTPGKRLNQAICVSVALSSSTAESGCSSEGTESPLPGLLSGVSTELLSKEDACCVWLSQDRNADWLRSCWDCPKDMESSKKPLMGAGVGSGNLDCVGSGCGSPTLSLHGRFHDREVVQFM